MKFINFFQNDIWTFHHSMINYRQSAAAAFLSPGEWWITGGMDYVNHDGLDLASTEIQHMDGTNLNFTHLPRPISIHVLISINITHTVLVGGGARADDGKLFIFER